MDGIEAEKRLEEIEANLAEEALEYRRRIEECKKMYELQCSQVCGLYSNDVYMVGMYNGMELLMSIMEQRKPMYAGIVMDKEPEQGGEPETQECENMIQRTMSGIVKGE